MVWARLAKRQAHAGSGAAQRGAESRYAHRKDVEYGTANDLIDAAVYRQDGMHSGHDTPTRMAIARPIQVLDV